MKAISLLITLVFLFSLGMGSIGIFSGSYGVKVLAQEAERYVTLADERLGPEMLAPVKVNLSLSSAPALNQEATLTFAVTLLELDLEDLDSSIEVLLSEGFELVSGSLSQEEKLSTGEDIQINAVIKSVKNGTWTIGEIGTFDVHDKLYVTVSNDTASISKHYPPQPVIYPPEEGIKRETPSELDKQATTSTDKTGPFDLSECEDKEEVEKCRCYSNYYKEQAVITENASFCETIKEKHECNNKSVDWCYDVVSNTIKDPRICEKIKNETLKYSCYKKMAYAMKSTSLCDKLESKLDKLYCKIDVSLSRVGLSARKADFILFLILILGGFAFLMRKILRPIRYYSKTKRILVILALLTFIPPFVFSFITNWAPLSKRSFSTTILYTLFSLPIALVLPFSMLHPSFFLLLLDGATIGLFIPIIILFLGPVVYFMLGRFNFNIKLRILMTIWIWYLILWICYLILLYLQVYLHLLQIS